MTEDTMLSQVRQAVREPGRRALEQSRRQVRAWFEQAAPLIQWTAIESPVGLLYVAASAKGVCSLNFGIDAQVFLGRLDPLARVERDPAALGQAARQLQEYFAGARRRFDLALDLDRLTPFQQGVLHITRGIAAGSLWTYGQVARALGKPRASRAVGQALAHNPVPIIIPCHRVVAGDGSLGGYGAGSGLDSKRFLLSLEGALSE